MAALLGLGLGLGMLLIWASCAWPQVARRPAEGGRWGRLLVEAGLPDVAPRSLLVVSVASTFVVTFVVLLATRTEPLAVVLGVLAGRVPLGVLGARARRRRREHAEVWPDAIDDLASAVRAGMSLPDAVCALADRGPVPLRPAFAGFALDYQVSGRFGDALDRLKVRLADPVGDRVVEGLRVAREVGGGELGRLLRNLSGYLRDDLHMRSDLEARQSWAVNGARLAVAAPWVVLLAMATQPEVIERYRSPAGALILAAAGLVCVVAYRLMIRVGRLPVEPRILS